MASKMTVKQAVLLAIANSISGIEHVICKADGSFVAKRNYFYKYGNTPQKLADQVCKAVEGATVLDMEDRYNAWPKDSYFAVTFAVDAQMVITQANTMMAANGWTDADAKQIIAEWKAAYN